MNIKLVFALAGIITTAAQAVVINEQVFIKNGGDINRMQDTLTKGYEPLRQATYQQPFHLVGMVTTVGCTGTWLGESEDYTWVLTAAHCYGNWESTRPIGESFSTNTPTGSVTWAEGESYVYIPQERLETGSGGSDIALVKIPTIKSMVDSNNKAGVQPVIYDNNNVLNKNVEFAGYGFWGVGRDVSGNYVPRPLPRRAWGMSKITEVSTENNLLMTTFEPSGETDLWARPDRMDSGSAWWQDHNGMKMIIATTRGPISWENSDITEGVALAKYAKWIQSIYPGAQLFTQQKFKWGGNDRKAEINSIFEYSNPYNHETEYFKLTRLGGDLRYWYFPITKKNNTWWTYLGTNKSRAAGNAKMLDLYKHWSSKDKTGKLGDMYIYLNPYNGDTEIFSLNSVDSTGGYGYFPTNKGDNKYWSYMMDLKF